MKTSDKLNSQQSPWIVVWICRVIIVVVVSFIIVYHQTVQRWTNELYKYSLTTWVFNSVYFETFWQAVCFLPISFIPYAIDKMSFFDKYKIEPSVKWVSPGITWNIVEAIVYLSPLMFLDTFTVKKYTGVNPSEWKLRRQSWLQSTRALPQNPPTLLEIAFQLSIAFILYDFLFCLIHYAMHKNRWLYKYIHSYHHDHKELHTRVTNQLTVTERIVLILSANEALKITGSHPLTRAIFVPIFQAWLVDNHCGYSFPWSLDKLAPFGLVGGPLKHYSHHVYGDRYYAPFFTYADKFIIGKYKVNKLKVAD